MTSFLFLSTSVVNSFNWPQLQFSKYVRFCIRQQLFSSFLIFSRLFSQQASGEQRRTGGGEEDRKRAGDDLNQTTRTSTFSLQHLHRHLPSRDCEGLTECILNLFGRFKRRMTDSHGPRLYFETFVEINREREITEANKKQTDGFPPRLWFLDGEKKRLDDERALNAGTVEVHSGISKDLLSASCSFSRV